MSSLVRERRNDRFNRTRLKLELRRGAKPTAVVLIGIALAILIAGYITSKVSRTLFSSTEEVSFAVDDATGVLASQDEIRVKGIRAGTITNVRMADGHPLITAKVQKQYGPIYRNARAVLRPNTPLQDIYLDVLYRGTPDGGKATTDFPVPASRTQVAVRVDDVLSVFSPDVRDRLRTLLDQLGNGMADRGQSLRQVFVAAAPLLAAAGRLSDQLAARQPLVKRLVHNTAVLTQELGRRDDTLRTLVASGSRAVGTLQDGRADLDAILRELPGTLTAIDTSFTAVRSVTGDVDDALVALRPVADKVGPALTDLRQLSAVASPAVQKLQTPVTQLVPLAQALPPLTRNLSTAVSSLSTQTDTLSKVTRDLVTCKKGVQRFFQWNVSIVKFGDNRGASPRGNVAEGSPASLEAVPACTPGQALGGRPVDLEKDGQ
ncbi:MAG: phospholipid/cholesterol/gamma-HCH transport system substrate-binding protein [Solirubrobacteraceae bacterium]|jgi:ABC-type transporter Mla subunit MlaD|nr:phospholipid/cholesterol/gamma-HCH transport system substrate-binding protein [Solirubrobacteraceae bacterium]